MGRQSNKITSKKQYYSIHSSNIQNGKRKSVPNRTWTPISDNINKVKKSSIKGSKYIGVYFDSDKNKYYFKLSKYRKIYKSKKFDNEIDAAYSYDQYIINNNLKRKLNFKRTKLNNNVIKHDYTKRTKIPDFTKNRIYSQQGEKCILCKNYLGEFRVMDHVKPLYLNGPDNITNYQALCGSCNAWKTYAFDKIIKDHLEKKPDMSLDMIRRLQAERYLKFNSPC
jgi:hypothetical protein